MQRPVWFRELFGFDETPSFTNNRSMFSIESLATAKAGGDVLFCPTAPRFPRMYLGEFETPSLGELRGRLVGADEGCGGGGCGGCGGCGG